MFSFLLLQVTGQNHFIGIKGGENRTNNAMDSYKSEFESRSGLAVGLTYEYFIDKHFSLGADLIYDQRGFNFRDTILNYSGNPNLNDQINKVDYQFNYISVPIKTGFNVGNNLYGFVSLGLCPSLLIDATTKSHTFNLDGTFTGSEKGDVFEQMSKFDFTGIFEIGGGYKFKQRYWLFTSFSYQYGIFTYYSPTYSTNGENRHKGTTLSLGLKYGLTDFIQKQSDASHVMDDYYIQKSKGQKKTALIILGSGLGIAALGGIVQLVENSSAEFYFDFTGAWIAIGGGCVSLFSIPFFISSGVNARKAATLTLNDQSIFIPQLNTSARTNVPSASLRIKF
jgi:hypothetical protein